MRVAVGFLVFAGMINGVFGASVDVNSAGGLGAFYGFGEIEIVKLNWGLRCLRTADFNGDGLVDIAAINNRDSKIEILLQKEKASVSTAGGVSDDNEADINELNPASKYKKAALPISVKAANMVCDDLNGDGLVDIAFYGDPAGLYVILQDKGDEKTKEKLSWGRVRKIKIEDGMPLTTTLEAGDLNNDGRSDVLLAGVDCVYVGLQTKDKGLSEPVKYPVTGRIAAIRLGDLNGDERTDLVMVTQDAEKPLSVRLGQENGQPGPQVQLKMEVPLAIDVYNYDGKKGDEILCVDAKSGRLIAYKLDTEQNGAEQEWPILYYPLRAAKESGRRDIAVADIDGDKLADVLVSDPGSAQVIFYRQIKGTGLDEPVEFGTLANVSAIAAGEFDKGGRVFALSQKEKTIGVSTFKDGRLTFPTPVAIEGEPMAMAIADADGDKKTDCVYVSKDANETRRFRITYNCLNAKTKGKYAMALTMNADPDGMMVLDGDNDDLQDVMIFTEYDGPVFVRQKEKGVFEQADSAGTQASLIRQAKASSAAMADIDGKDGEEMLVAQQNFARSLRLIDGKWTVLDQYNAKNTENTVSAAAAFDVDGKDGPEVILVDGAKGEMQVLASGEDKTYRFNKLVEVGSWGGGKMEFAAITGGKEKSIVLFDNDKFALVTPLAKTFELKSQFSYETTVKDGKYANIVSGDINSDGVSDFVMVEYKKNHLDILTLDQNGQAVGATRFQVFEKKSYREEGGSQAGAEPSELVIADVTGDEKNDIVTITHDRVIVYPQD